MKICSEVAKLVRFNSCSGFMCKISTPCINQGLGLDSENLDEAKKSQLLLTWIRAETTSEIYKAEGSKIERVINSISSISYVLPITLTALMLFTKQSSNPFIKDLYEPLEACSLAGSTLILVLGIISLTYYKNESKKEIYSVGVRNNINLANLAKKMYFEERYDEYDFLKKIENMQDQNDAMNDPNVSDKMRYKFYNKFLDKHGFSCPDKQALHKYPKANIFDILLKNSDKCKTCGMVFKLKSD